jgi:hypothetical protein
MMRPREASKNHKVPFQMESVTRRLLIDRGVVERVAQNGWTIKRLAQSVLSQAKFLDEPEA